MKKVKEPAPHAKAAQIEKEAVRALSVDEVEEALTKSTYGAPEIKKNDKYIEDLEDEILTVRATYSALEGKYMKLEQDNKKLRDTIKELRNVRTGMAECNKDIEVLKAECIALKDENKKCLALKAEYIALKEQNQKYLREIDDYKKTISKMKYAHEEEVRALNDDIMEAKVLGKKAGEYCSMLDADSDTFETILELAKIINGLAKSAESVSLLIKDEIEGHV